MWHVTTEAKRLKKKIRDEVIIMFKNIFTESQTCTVKVKTTMLIVSVRLTSVRFESFERHGLFVVVIFILPDIVAATCTALAPVVEVGHGIM